MNADQILETPTPTVLAGHVTNISELKHVTNNFSNSEVVINLPPQKNDNELEKAIAISNFVTDYYQLIVTADKNGFSHNKIAFRPDQALRKDCVPPEIFKRCSTLSPRGIEELKSFPALICEESPDYFGMSGTKQVIYGYLKEIQRSGDFIVVQCGVISTIPRAMLRENAGAFGLCMDCAISDFNRCGWSVRKINLFEAFAKTGVPGLSRPNIYQ